MNYNVKLTLLMYTFCTASKVVGTNELKNLDEKSGHAKPAAKKGLVPERRRHRLVAQAYRDQRVSQRGENGEVTSIEESNPLDARFSESDISRDVTSLSSGWFRFIPKLVKRRGGVSVRGVLKPQDRGVREDGEARGDREGRGLQGSGEEKKDSGGSSSRNRCQFDNDSVVKRLSAMSQMSGCSDLSARYLEIKPSQEETALLDFIDMAKKTDQCSTNPETVD